MSWYFLNSRCYINLHYGKMSFQDYFFKVKEQIHLWLRYIKVVPSAVYPQAFVSRCISLPRSNGIKWKRSDPEKQQQTTQHEVVKATHLSCIWLAASGRDVTWRLPRDMCVIQHTSICYQLCCIYQVFWGSLEKFVQLIGIEKDFHVLGLCKYFHVNRLRFWVGQNLWLNDELWGTGTLNCSKSHTCMLLLRSCQRM